MTLVFVILAAMAGATIGLLAGAMLCLASRPRIEIYPKGPVDEHAEPFTH
jgi:hypothetical protein